MSDPVLKKLTLNDVKAYREIRLEMIQETPAAFGETYDEVFKQDIPFFESRIKKAPIIGAFIDGELIGTAGYFVQSALKSQHKAYLWGVYVKPEFRGNSISYDMTLAVLEVIPDEIEMIQLDVLKRSVSAHKTYLKVGFQDWGLEKKAVKDHGKYEDLIHMVKFLK